jgi:hypothetical protein
MGAAVVWVAHVACACTACLSTRMWKLGRVDCASEAEGWQVGWSWDWVGQWVFRGVQSEVVRSGVCRVGGTLRGGLGELNSEAVESAAGLNGCKGGVDRSDGCGGK